MGGGLLRVRLFGELELRLNGAPLPPVESARARSLLAYLMLHRAVPQPRQRLAFLLWPDSTEAQARTNLRHLLHNLRQSAPALMPFLDMSRATLTWQADDGFWLDVAAFEEALATVGDSSDVDALEQALSLYRGELLPDCYDDWIAAERERLRRLHLHALDRLVSDLAERGHTAAAIRHAQELVRHDPLDERTYVQLMRLHASRGDRTQALRAYHLCAATLERELGVGPGAATRDLYDALLVDPHDIQTRASQAAAEGVPLVGRTAEWELLVALWRAAEKGHARMALVLGEAGIGKTRVVEELRAWCARRGAAVVEARCYGAEGAVAYAPIAAWLRSAALRPVLPRLDPGDIAELSRLLPELQDAAVVATLHVGLPENEQRVRLFAAVDCALRRAGGPLLLILDDAHWCDRHTFQVVHHIVRSNPGTPLLVVATARPEEIDEAHPLHDLVLGMQRLDRLVELELHRLTPEQTATLGERLSGGPLASEAALRLHVETEGNPLFIIEAMRAGWIADDKDAGWIAPKVEGVIRYRLARLTEAARRLAGVAATIGREFSADVLEHASAMDAAIFVRALDELWRSRIVRESGAGDYDFSHDKIREVAYRLLSPAQRRHNHLAVAGALTRAHGTDAGPYAVQIAAHYERAGRVAEALDWYEGAAETAQRLHDSADAVRLLEHALQLAAARPDADDASARELRILTALLTPLASSQGFMSVRLREVQQRGLEVARRTAALPPPQLLASIGIAALARDDFATAQHVGTELRARAAAENDDALLLEAEYVLGIAAFWQGELEMARRHFEAAAEGAHAPRRRLHLLRAWLDPQVICLSRLANTLWFLGEPDAACRARDAALAAAVELGHRPTHSGVLTFAALLALEMGEIERIRECVAALRTEPGAERWPVRLAAELLHGYLLAVDGRPAEGLRVIRGILDDPHGADHAPGMRAVGVRLLMAAHAAVRDERGRLAAADRMLALGGAGRLWESEARRARAESLAALGAPADVVAAELEKAIGVARRQGARALAVRAEAARERLRVAP